MNLLLLFLNHQYHYLHNMNLLLLLFLTMADHIFDPEMLEHAASTIPPKNGAILCVDYKLDEVFDMDDATKVLVQNGKVANIGKKIPNYNAVDTGLFICTKSLFSALDNARAKSQNDDCSLSEGIATLMKSGTMAVQDIGELQRITGYLVGTTDRWNSGKLAELNDRVVHK